MKRILIIDDDRIIGEMLKYMFNFKGYEVLTITNPSQTFQVVTDNKIDLILLDNLLTEVQGIHFCKKLKNNINTRHIPIIMMSGLNEIKTECLSAGAAAFISKPFEMNKFFEKVETVLAEV